MVTQQMARYVRNVYVTEVSSVMASLLQKRGYKYVELIFILIFLNVERHKLKFLIVNIFFNTLNKNILIVGDISSYILKVIRHR